MVPFPVLNMSHFYKKMLFYNTYTILHKFTLLFFWVGIILSFHLRRLLLLLMALCIGLIIFRIRWMVEVSLQVSPVYLSFLLSLSFFLFSTSFPLLWPVLDIESNTIHFSYFLLSILFCVRTKISPIVINPVFLFFVSWHCQMLRVHFLFAFGLESLVRFFKISLNMLILFDRFLSF